MPEHYKDLRETIKQMEAAVSEQFADTWRETFAEPTSVRVAIERTQADRKFLAALLLAVPEFADSPNPRTLTNWLARHENLPLGSGRFVRVGHRWRVVEPLTIAA